MPSGHTTMSQKQGADFSGRCHPGCGRAGSRRTKQKDNWHQERTTTESTPKLMKYSGELVPRRTCDSMFKLISGKNWNIFRGSSDSLKLEE